jgi:trans-2,3-dihydro-3-hydroxyanthranilate isomerase
MGTIAALAEFDPFAAPAAPGGRAYLILDVFSEVPLAGNQLAVFTDGQGLDGGAMQALARELKLSETVFMLPAEGEGDARVRIFTPAAELPFAGHPVLGSAAVLAGALERTEVLLETGSGLVAVAFERQPRRTASGWMRQPIPTWEEFEASGELLAALGLDASGLPIEVYCNGPRHVYVELPSREAVAVLEPDLLALARLGELGVSCFAGGRAEYKSRMFAPGLGVAEDPATGSAAGPLALHLARHGRIDFGEEIEISQGSEILRPSLLRARVFGTAAAPERVEVGGSAVIVAAGRFWPAGPGAGVDPPVSR